MERSSSGLRVIAIIFQVLAWVFLAVGVIVTVALYGVLGGVIANAPSWLAGVGRLIAFLPIVSGILYFLFFFGTSNAIRLLLQIDENARTASQVLTQR